MQLDRATKGPTCELNEAATVGKQLAVCTHGLEGRVGDGEVGLQHTTQHSTTGWHSMLITH
jgi:hypothetical protein